MITPENTPTPRARIVTSIKMLKNESGIFWNPHQRCLLFFDQAVVCVETRLFSCTTQQTLRLCLVVLFFFWRLHLILAKVRLALKLFWSSFKRFELRVLCNAVQRGFNAFLALAVYPLWRTFWTAAISVHSFQFFCNARFIVAPIKWITHSKFS